MVRQEFNLPNSQLIQERHEAILFLDLLRKPSYRKRCFVGFMVQFTEQTTATQVVNNKSLSEIEEIEF